MMSDLNVSENNEFESYWELSLFVSFRIQLPTASRMLMIVVDLIIWAALWKIINIGDSRLHVELLIEILNSL